MTPAPTRDSNVQRRSDARGHLRVRGLSGLYCTHEPATTRPFQQLSRQAGDFAVVETGWTKLDLAQPHLLDLGHLARLRELLVQAFAPTPGLSAATADCAGPSHPARDGRNARRIVDASEDFLRGKLRTPLRKRLSAPWRRLQIRSRTGDWGR